MAELCREINQQGNELCDLSSLELMNLGQSIQVSTNKITFYRRQIVSVIKEIILITCFSHIFLLIHHYITYIIYKCIYTSIYIYIYIYLSYYLLQCTV